MPLASAGAWQATVQRDNVANAPARDTLDGDVLAAQRGVLAVLLRLAARYEEGLPLAGQALVFMDAKQPAPHWRAETVRLALGDRGLEQACGRPCGSGGLRRGRGGVRHHQASPPRIAC